MGLPEAQFEESFSRLIDAKLPVFRAISVRIVDTAADADDAIQAALLKAWQRRDSFRGESELAGWVSRIVIRESYDLLRRRVRERKKLAELPAGEADRGREAALRRLDRAIAALPELYRETIHIALLSGVDSDSAAETLGCSVNTLYQRIFKAKRLLKENYGRLQDE